MNENPPEPTREAHLQDLLDHFGDARKLGRWKSRDPDYVVALSLTPADIPQLLTQARQWVDREDWPEDEDDLSIHTPVHAWRALAHLGAVEAVPLLLDMMKPMDEGFDDWYLEEFPFAFALIGPPSIQPLAAYLTDEGNLEFPRVCTAHALEETALRHPQCRGEVVRVLTRQLRLFGQQTPVINAFLIGALSKLRARNAADVIERAYADDRVDIESIGNWNTLRAEMGIEDHGLVPEHLASKNIHWRYESLHQTLDARKPAAYSPDRYKRRKRKKHRKQGKR